MINLRMLVCLSLTIFSSFAGAQGASSGPRPKLETNANFDELLVQGKYQFSDESVTTVEEDKVLDSLLGVRKDFRDRLERSALKR